VKDTVDIETATVESAATEEVGAATADEREQALAGIRRQLEWQVAAGRRFVIDGELASMIARPPDTRPTAAASATAAPLVGSAPPGTARRQQSAATRAETLAELEHKALGCSRCPLHAGRTKVVFGVGNPDADLMFIGEAPGRDEDLAGEPFVGRAGQLLTRIIEAIKLKRTDVYIANVLKCRPPENRNPTSAEIALCSPFLYEQIEWVAPKVICALGRFACMTLLKSTSALGRMRGRVHDFQGTPVVVTYHPAALLRYEKLKRPTWEDMQAVQKILAGQMPGNWAK
jgi:DNA polymerase